MRSLIILAALLCSACTMTPAQKKWTAIGVSVVATGMIIAHQQDNGSPVLGGSAGTSGKGGAFNPCTSSNPKDCK